HPAAKAPGFDPDHPDHGLSGREHLGQSQLGRRAPRAIEAQSRGQPDRLRSKGDRDAERDRPALRYRRGPASVIPRKGSPLGYRPKYRAAKIPVTPKPSRIEEMANAHPDDHRPGSPGNQGFPRPPRPDRSDH